MQRIFPPMTASGKKHLKSLLRWSIAALGTWYVLSQLHWSDRALCLLQPVSPPVWSTVISGDEQSPQLLVRPANSDRNLTIPADQVVSEPDKKDLTVAFDGHTVSVLGVDLADRSTARRLLVQDSTGVHWVPAAATNYRVTIPHPRIQIGVRHLLASARRSYLCWSILIFPLTFFITAFRWHELLKAMDVHLTPQRSFVLNMVGAFYNTFMPGSTGGDVLKAYYVAKQTHHRMRGVVSVLVDRAIGLLALIILGGAMATLASIRYQIAETRGVAIGSLVIVLCTVVFLTVFYDRRLFQLSGMAWLLRKLPMQHRLNSAMEALHLYGRRPGLAAAALMVSFPVHIIVILSALLAGIAFGLNIPLQYYWMVVPVTVLAGSIPISPQGAGVMEYFAILLLRPLGCTVAEAIALTMSIRLVQVLWNLTGGIFVLRGGYHAPTVSEQKVVEQEDEDDKA